MSCDMMKLEYLKETKQIFKNKLDPKGKSITDTTPFREYARFMGQTEPTAAIVCVNSVDVIFGATKEEE